MNAGAASCCAICGQQGRRPHQHRYSGRHVALSLEKYTADFVETHLAGYLGMLNVETIGGKVIEVIHVSRLSGRTCMDLGSLLPLLTFIVGKDRQSVGLENCNTSGV
jgi:hypothetical protein